MQHRFKLQRSAKLQTEYSCDLCPLISTSLLAFHYHRRFVHQYTPVPSRCPFCPAPDENSTVQPVEMGSVELRTHVLRDHLKIENFFLPDDLPGDIGDLKRKAKGKLSDYTMGANTAGFQEYLVKPWSLFFQTSPETT